MGNSHPNYRVLNASNNPLITNAILKIGWLIRKSATRKLWTKRYVLLLKSNIMLYFADSNCTEWIATDNFSKLKSITQDESKWTIITANKTLELKAINKDDAEDWIQHIKQRDKDKKTPSKSSTTHDNSKSAFDDEVNMISGGLMGYLIKRGELRRSWNNRWCILMPSRLLIYFSDETCQNFKGCADLRRSGVRLLFDNARSNYFCIETSARIWEFECSNGNVVKEWSSIVQFMIDSDHKILILKCLDSNDKYPSKQLVRDYFKSFGIIEDIMWMQQYQIYVIVMNENENEIESLMAQKRLHIISTYSRSTKSYDSYISNNSTSSYTSNASDAVKYELFALRLSEYMGQVYSCYANDVTCKEKEEGMILSRRFSIKALSKSKSKKNVNKKRRKSLVSFGDRYNKSALDHIKRMCSDPRLTEGKEMKEYEFASSTDETDDGEEKMDDDDDGCEYWSSDDVRPSHMRMTSVTDRGQQICYDPNELKTYRNSSIFNFNSRSPQICAKARSLVQSATDISYDDDEDEDEDGDGDGDQVIECPMIIDNGSGYIKAGFGISIVPIVIRNECMKCGDEYALFDDHNNDDNVMHPMVRDEIMDCNAMNFMWQHIIEGKFGADSMNSYPLMITTAPTVDDVFREKWLEFFMETHSLYRFYLMNTALSNFYYTGKARDDDECCVIVDIGHGSTHVSCIYNGMYCKGYSQSMYCAGMDIMNAVKLKGSTKYRLPDGRTLSIEKEEYELYDDCAAQVLFNRNAKSIKSLQSVVMNCINKFDDDYVEQRMYGNIYCCGGGAQFSNCSSRLQSELTQCLTRKVSIVSSQDIEKAVLVKSVNEAQLSAWYGATIISSLSTFHDKWITNNEYNEYGTNILKRKCTHNQL